jgi:hypothetical protein
LAIREKVQPDAWRTFDARSMLGGSLLGQGKYVEAEPLVVSGYEGMEAREEAISHWAKPRLTEAGIRIVRLYAAWGQPAKADEWKRKLRLPDLPGVVFARP